MDRKAFYSALRKRDSGVFGSSLSQGQVDSLETLLDEGMARALPARHMAYVLATAYHEVGSAMQPKSENLNYTSAARIRAVWPSRFPTLASAQPYVRNPRGLANKVYGGRLGNTGPDDGWTYRGRGFPQTTGKSNYERSGRIVGIDLVKDPDRMMESRIAAVTMIESMKAGLYTGKKLSDYLGGATPDYTNARRIINADVAANGGKIAGYARAFEKALAEARYAPGTAPAQPPAPSPAPIPPPAPQEPATGIASAIAALFRAIASLFKR